MWETRAAAQDIRPLRILILNLMPKKIDFERQLLRMLSNTPLQVDVELLQTATHASKNTAAEHLLKFYKVFDDVKEQYFDGMIITGAPVEHLEFEEVGYWDELCQIMEWSKSHVHSTLHICWGAQAALHYHYGLQKVCRRRCSASSRTRWWTRASRCCAASTKSTGCPTPATPRFPPRTSAPPASCTSCPPPRLPG